MCKQGTFGAAAGSFGPIEDLHAFVNSLRAMQATMLSLIMDNVDNKSGP